MTNKTVKEKEDKWVSFKVGDTLFIKGAPVEIIGCKHNVMVVRFLGELGKHVVFEEEN